MRSADSTRQPPEFNKPGGTPGSLAALPQSRLDGARKPLLHTVSEFDPQWNCRTVPASTRVCQISVHHKQ